MTFSATQTAVLEEVHRRRLTVVRAGPGSGKTRVFVEVLKRQLEEHGSTNQGVAALSFTNVAHEVITERLGGPPGPPHFVGTIDAFLLRFVVLPFWRLLGFCRDGPRLMPDALAKSIEFPEISYGAKRFERASIFCCSLTAGSEAEPIATLRNKFGNPFPASGAVSNNILSRKEQEWKKYGRITHSDSHYISSRLLRGQNSEQILSIITQRFPVLLVDEFQDTGWFQGRALMRLLETATKALVVGDPDQAIFQFSGTDRQLFDKVDRIAGTTSLLLDETHRCSRRVSAVASALSRSGKQVIPKSDAIEGSAYLLVHESKIPDRASLLKALDAHTPSSLGYIEFTFLTRRRPRPEMARSAPWSGGVPHHICEAVSRLHEGNSKVAVSLLSRALSKLLLDTETPTDEELLAFGINSVQWRREAAALLLDVGYHDDKETWNEWILRTKSAVKNFANYFSLNGKKIASCIKRASKGGDAVRLLRYSQPATVATHERQQVTIHAAKGREYDAVVLALEKPHKKHAPCPSASWWDNATNSEEREVAYVACTRARMTLCIAIHTSTYQAFARERPLFLALFEVIIVSAQGESLICTH